MKLLSSEGGCFLAGLAIGAGSAVLMAPKSGTETVSDLKRKARRGVASIKHEFDAAGCTVKETITRGKKALRREAGHIAAAMEAGRRAYREASTPGETLQ